MANAKAFLWFLPSFAFLAVAAVRGDAMTDLERLLLRSWLASTAALGFIKVSLAGRGIMGIRARWERALLRWIFLLAIVINIFPTFIVLEYVARMLLLGAWASHASAVVTVAAHLYFGWAAIFGVYT